MDRPNKLVNGVLVPLTDAEWVQYQAMQDVPLPVDTTAKFIPLPMLRQRIEKLGMWDAFAGYIAQFPTLWLRLFSLESGVDPAYPDFIPAFDEMDIPQVYRDYILAPPSAGVGTPPALS